MDVQLPVLEKSFLVVSPINLVCIFFSEKFNPKGRVCVGRHSSSLLVCVIVVKKRGNVGSGGGRKGAVHLGPKESRRCHWERLADELSVQGLKPN